MNSLKQQVLSILEECPESRECNLTLYNALCNVYYVENCEEHYVPNDLDEEQGTLFEEISVIQYLRLLKMNKLPYLHDIIKIRKSIKEI